LCCGEVKITTETYRFDLAPFYNENKSAAAFWLLLILANATAAALKYGSLELEQQQQQEQQHNHGRAVCCQRQNGISEANAIAYAAT
jgi:hypothetical protein